MTRCRRGILEQFERRNMLAVVADIDNDGHNDIVAANDDIGLAWLRNIDGRADFEINRLSDVEGSIKPVDLDMDGDRDIVTNKAWYEFDGGTFIRHSFDVGEVDHAITQDFGGDGDLDIVLRRSPREYTIVENAGNPLELRLVDVLIPDDVNCDQAADFDGDGDLDCVAVDIVGDGFSGDAWLELSFAPDGHDQNPVGFEVERMLTFEGNDELFATLTVDDVDGDGDLDALVNTREGLNELGNVLWHENRFDDEPGELSFSTPQSFITYDTFGAVERNEFDLITDADGDGDLDASVIGTHFYTRRGFRWFENQDGTITECGCLIPLPRRASLFPTGSGDPGLGDLNGDGIFDRFVVENEVRWLDGKLNSGTRLEQIEIIRDAVAFGTTSVSHDLTGDRIVDRNDLRFAVDEMTRTAWGDVDGDGMFTSSDLVAVLAIGEYEDDIADNSNWQEGDWNADGEFDSSDLVWVLQQGGYEQSATLQHWYQGVSSDSLSDTELMLDRNTETSATFTMQGTNTIRVDLSRVAAIESIRFIHTDYAKDWAPPMPSSATITAFDAAGQQIVEQDVAINFGQRFGDYNTIDVGRIEGVEAFELSFDLGPNALPLEIYEIELVGQTE